MFYCGFGAGHRANHIGSYTRTATATEKSLGIYTIKDGKVTARIKKPLHLETCLLTC